MYFLNVENLRLINIRNYQDLYIELNKNINIFIGKNAQGKTNLIESIYMCATGRSFRTNRDREIINLKKDQAYIAANIKLGNYKKLIEIKLQKEKPKRIRINRNELKSFRELESGLYVVLFSPDDLKIIKGGPQERRNFIDNAISQLRPIYSYNLSRYKKILYQRNNLLKSNKFKGDAKSLLDLFDVQIAKVGTSILMERNRFLNALNALARDIHRQITNNREDLTIKYDCQLPLDMDWERIEDAYLELLKKNMDRDLEYGTTSIGPHRDDFIAYLDGKDARIFGSQGQQRTVVLSLVLSEVELIRNEIGSYPVLLLDDVFSELDDERRNYLVKFFGKMQTFITLTDGENIKSMENLDKTIYHIEDGKLKMGSCL